MPPRLNSHDDDVSDDEPPNYLSVLEEHHSMQRNDLYARNQRAQENPVPSAFLQQQPHQRVSLKQAPQPLTSSKPSQQHKPKRTPASSRPDNIRIDLEDEKEMDHLTREAEASISAAAGTYSNGGDSLPRKKILKKKKKGPKKVSSPREEPTAESPVVHGLNEAK